jgi:hypothetical protein
MDCPPTGLSNYISPVSRNRYPCQSSSVNVGCDVDDEVAFNDLKFAALSRGSLGEMSYDCLRYVNTPYEPGYSSQNQMASFVRFMFDDHVLNNTTLKSTAISDVGTTKQNPYEVKKG